MKKLILTTFLAAGLTGCVVSGHPSTDKNHSHVDTSSTRYDKYDPDYDYHDGTQPKKNRRVYEEFNKKEREDYDDDAYEDEEYYRNYQTKYRNWERTSER